MAGYAGVPPLRADPFTPDEFDAKRVALAKRFWHGQDELLRRRDRQVEENIRMLAGQHWSVYNPYLQKFLDITQWMTDDERRWRQRPVVNRVLYWYILTHSRLTENPPILTFQPSTGDRFDAELAEVADTIFKTKWRETQMLEVLDRLMAWMIPGGRAHLMSVVDPRKGALKAARGPAALQLLGPDGMPVPGPDGQPIVRVVPDAPYAPDASGNFVPQAQLTMDGLQTGTAYSEHEGDLRIDVLSCLECRGQWGPQPWHEKSWHELRSFLTPEEVYELFGVEVQPDAIFDGTDDPGYLTRLLFGTGFFGAASAKPGSEFASSPVGEGYVEVLSLWQRPCAFPGMEEDDQKPGGRLLVATKDRVLRDGQRPFRFKSASSIRTFDFVKVMGRPSGTSPQEMLNPINRAVNRHIAQIQQHANLVSDPIALIDDQSGLQDVEFTNKPGARYTVRRRPNVPALEFVPPPSLGRDVYNSHKLMTEELEKLGNVEGAEGSPPTTDPSGKLIKELRYNSDRFLGSTARRTVEELARMADDWIVIFGKLYTEEKVIEYAGEDSVPRTMYVYPELFREGKVNIIADIESMLPESRSERINRVNQMYQMGAFGLPGDPRAIQKWLEMARFPHLARTAWPGGVHFVTAQQENGQLARGVPATQIPVFEWYDDEVHLAVLDNFMAAPEFLRIDPQMQSQFVIHRTMHQQAFAAKQLQALKQAVMTARITGAAGIDQQGGGGGNGGPPKPPAAEQPAQTGAAA
jgi:hypothetical protein